MTNPPVLDLLAKYDPLIAEHARLLSTGIRDPFGIVMEKVLSPTEAIIKGSHNILLGNYRRLVSDRAIVYFTVVLVVCASLFVSCKA